MKFHPSIPARVCFDRTRPSLGGRLILLATCLSGLANASHAAPLRFVAEVYGSTQHQRQEATNTGVNAAVNGSFLAGGVTAQWNVTAGAANGSLSARTRLDSVTTNGSGLAPDIGGSSLASIDDTLYFTRGQGPVQLAITLALTGSIFATPGDNPFGGPRATCLGGVSVVFDNQVFFGLSEAGSETHIRFFDTGNLNTGDMAIPITYSLEIQAEAHDGVADGDFSHTAHLYLSAPGITFRTESGQTYAPPPPALNIQTSGGALLISWPTNASGYLLETTTNLATGLPWDPVTDIPGVVGVEMVVTNSLPGTVRFYRLKK